MDNQMDKILLEELKRFGQINEYANSLSTGKIGGVAGFEFPSRIKELGEQDEEPAADELPGGEEPEGDAPDEEVVDIDTEEGGDDLDLGGEEETDIESEDTDSGAEEIDVTDLVTMAKDAESKAGEVVDSIEGQSGKIDSLVNKLDDLESKLGEMDTIITAIDDLETKFEAMRPETPEEKLELRSLDSGPYTEKPLEFWDRKKDEMSQQKGKHEYVLTTDDAEDYNDSEIKNTFASNYEPEEDE